MTKVCICQVCNCGRHHCPHKPAGTVPKGNQPCTISEYANKYHKHPIDPRKPIKPNQEPMKNDGPMDDKTTHRVDYIEHPMEKPYVHQGDTYRQPEGDIDHMTNYTKDYTKKPIERTKGAKKDYVKKYPGKFQGEPTYKTDYRKWAMNRPDKITHDPGYQPPDAPFEGASNYQTDYLPKKVAPRSSMRPTEQAKNNNDPFSDRTGYRDYYIKHPLPPKYMKEKQEYAPNKAPLDGLSNYMKDYVPKDMDKTKSCKPDANAYQSGAPFEDGTTHRTDYQPKHVARPYVREPDQYRKPEGDMDMHTTTHTDYTKKPIDRMVAKRPMDRKKVPGKFDDTTNYKEDYRKWQLGERPMQTMKSGYNPPEKPFEGISNYQTDYIPKNQEPRRSMKPVETARMTNDPFPDRTGYRDYYIKHPLPPKHMREKQEYAPNKAPLEGLSNYMKDYIPKGMDKTKSCKPDANAYQSGAPFEDDTTHRVDYKQWQADRPFVHEPERYSKPEGDMDMHTTTHTDYTKKPIERSVAAKPTSVRRLPGKFDGTTNYHEDFRKWPHEGRQKPTMKPGYAPPDAPFEGTSNYQTEYIPRRQTPLRSMRPSDRAIASNAPFEDHTEYRQEYIKKKVLPCPAAVLDNPQSRYVFSEQDPTGHKWYEPVSTSVQELPASCRITSASKQQLTALSVA